MDQNQHIVLDTLLPLVIFNMLFKPKYKERSLFHRVGKKSTQRYGNLLIRWKLSQIIGLGEINTSQCKMECCYL